MPPSPVSRWLSRQSGLVFALYAMFASFATYASMYAFRKPFTATSFVGPDVFGIDYKTALIIAQVIGYMLSKFIGIKVVSEIPFAKRAPSIIGLVLIAEISLVAFWHVPAPWNVVFMFINGLPLGMIWGLVFGYLEGRRLTEVLAAGLSASFIVSSGFVKSIGKTLMTSCQVPESAMPAVTGALFFGPLVLFVLLLNQLPPPTPRDERERTRRIPMRKDERRTFLVTFATGITLLTLVYMGLTAYRDLRDSFAAEIWAEVGYGNQPMIFTSTEIPVAIIVLVLLASLMAIRDNRRALMANHLVIGAGFLLLGGATAAFDAGLIGPILWSIAAGIGLYMGYVPFNCILFDRLIAAYKHEANAGFLIYVADAFGYLASVGVLLVKNFLIVRISWVDFFVDSGYVVAVAGVILTVLSALYFGRSLGGEASDPIAIAAMEQA
jgi:hypothetical protein